MPAKGSDRDEQQALLSLIQKVEGEEWASTKKGWKLNSGVSHSLQTIYIANRIKSLCTLLKYNTYLRSM